jgi:hypothetical protein
MNLKTADHTHRDSIGFFTFQKSFHAANSSWANVQHTAITPDFAIKYRGLNQSKKTGGIQSAARLVYHRLI